MYEIYQNIKLYKPRFSLRAMNEWTEYVQCKLLGED